MVTYSTYAERVVDITAKPGTITEQAVDLIVVDLFQGVTQPDGATGAVDAALGGAIREVVDAGDFSGKAGETALFYTRGALRSARVLVVGLGDESRFSAASARDAAATAARRARDLGARTMATVVHGAAAGGLDPRTAAQALVEGTRLGLYRFAGHKSHPSKDWKADPQGVVIVETDPDRLATYQAGMTRGAAIASGVELARAMVNEPGNHMTPLRMALAARQLADETGLQVQVLGRDEMAELGMGILLAVAAESDEPPQFIILEHNAGRKDLPTLILVGKGVTFDSGGLSIKPADEMWRMKADMAGAAAVIAVLGVTARLNLPLHVVGLAPCTENLPGGRAQKPGDVFTGMMGKTTEVISTDAEGRMLLADALAYAARFQPQAVVDIATLTAAQRIALGPQAAALFSNDETLATRLLAAGEASGDRLWRMPLYDEYLEAIKSHAADVKNSGGRYGGVGTSAKFLEHFTEGYPWAHIDMSSMSLSEEDRPSQPRGATGYGVRLLSAFLEGWIFEG
jgi:leucyl aminopeptidase